MSLTLDGYWQFSSRDEHVFHEVLVDPAMTAAPRINRVLILGGGDGLAARNVLRYPEVERVVLCEIDEAVIEMTTTVEEMVELCADSLRDPRVEIVVEDALTLLARVSDPFDVVICDFPVPTTTEAAPAQGDSLYQQIEPALETGGVLSVQASLDPLEFWDALESVGSCFTWLQPRLAELRDDEWANFVLASSATPSWQRNLARGLTFLTPALMDALVIDNRGGREFHTRQYGRRPSYPPPGRLG